MTTVTIELPEDVFAALRRTPSEFAAEIRCAAAIHWYQQGDVSQEKAAEIAGLSRADFLRELGRRRIDVIHVDMDEIRREAERG